MVLDAENSHGLPSASRRPLKVHVIIQSESEDLRTREADDVNPSLKAKDKCLSSSIHAETEFNLPLPFCFIWAPNRLDYIHPQWGR